MGLDQDFLELLSHTATWEAYTGEDTFGNNAYGLPITIKCFVTEENVNFAANDTNSRQRLGPTTGYRMITDGLGIKSGDRMTVAGKVGTVIGVQINRDETMPQLFQNVDVSTEQEV